ncbi:MAG: hypothetical protein MJ244_05535 [Clostridia bacterium]|nr:hypothetical protein [Clostridia bacterium]
MTDYRNLTDEDLTRVSGGKTNGMCDVDEKLYPYCCEVCANCVHCEFTGEYNEYKNYALCWCNDLEKEFWVNLSSYPGVVNKTKKQ